MIINPISYPGNKTKLIKQIVPELYMNDECFIDIFAGSGMVSVNSGYQRIICNDISEKAIDMIKFFYTNSSDTIIRNTENIIKDYNLTYSKKEPKGTYVELRHEGLSLYNKEGYNRLKNDYNNDNDLFKLFVLLIYGFNHYMRFNSNGEFNVPVGKVDFSKSIYEHTIEFSNNIKKLNIDFLSKDFRDPSLYENDKALYYFDPPYLITTAPYNNLWNEDEEYALLKILDDLNSKNIRFLLSNVLSSDGKENTILKEWASKYNIIRMKRQYKNSNYQKNNKSEAEEVLIKNY